MTPSILNAHDIKLILLDRDGVINEDSVDYIKSPSEWHAIAGSLHAIYALNRAGFLVAVVSNQSGISRGYYTEATLQDIHQKMKNELHDVGGHIDAIFYCPHQPNDGCLCRKPKPGLLENALQHFQVHPTQALLIGDSVTDLQAAHCAECFGVLVKSNKDHVLQDSRGNTVTPRYGNLSEAVSPLLANQLVPTTIIN